MREGRNRWESLSGFIMEEQGCRGLDFTWVLHRVMLSGPCAAGFWVKQCTVHQGQSLHIMSPVLDATGHCPKLRCWVPDSPKYIGITQPADPLQDQSPCHF